MTYRPSEKLAFYSNRRQQKKSGQGENAIDFYRKRALEKRKEEYVKKPNA